MSHASLSDKAAGQNAHSNDGEGSKDHPWYPVLSACSREERCLFGLDYFR